MNKKNWFIVLLFSILILSCREIINLDVDEVEKKIVIEGLVLKSDKNNKTTIFFTVNKITYLNESTYSEAIKDANVIVEDNKGNKYDFEYTEKIPKGIFTYDKDGKKIFTRNKMFIGRYEPQKDIKNIVIDNNYTYTAKVEIEDIVYEAVYKPIKTTQIKVSKVYKENDNYVFDLDVSDMQQNLLVRYGKYGDVETWHDDEMNLAVVKKTNFKKIKILTRRPSIGVNYGVKVISVSDNMYNYFSRLLKNQLGDVLSSFNDNPYFKNMGNWNNDALGYFMVSDFDFIKVNDI